MSSLKYVIFYLNFLLAGIFMFEIGLLPEGLVFLWNDKDCLRCSGRGSRVAARLQRVELAAGSA